MTKIMMKELNKLIVKDIFNCLSEEDAERLRVLRVEWHIDDEAYERLKAMITSRDVHERIEHARREPNRWIRMARYGSGVDSTAVCCYLSFVARGKQPAIATNGTKPGRG